MFLPSYPCLTKEINYCPCVPHPSIQSSLSPLLHLPHLVNITYVFTNLWMLFSQNLTIQAHPLLTQSRSLMFIFILYNNGSNKMYVMQDNTWGTFIDVFNVKLKFCIMCTFYNVYNISKEWVIITQAIINIL